MFTLAQGKASLHYFLLASLEEWWPPQLGRHSCQGISNGVKLNGEGDYTESRRAAGWCLNFHIGEVCRIVLMWKRPDSQSGSRKNTPPRLQRQYFPLSPELIPILKAIVNRLKSTKAVIGLDLVSELQE